MPDDSRFKGQREALKSAGSYHLDIGLSPPNLRRSCAPFSPWSLQKTASCGITHVTKRANHSERCSETFG